MPMKGPKRLLVTSDLSFMDTGELIGLSNFPSSAVERSNPVTPPDQKIPSETSPHKLASPTNEFPLPDVREMNAPSSTPVVQPRVTVLSKMRLRRNN